MKGYFIGGGIGSLAGAAFMVRDGDIAGRDITIFEASSLTGGSLDGASLYDGSFSLRGAHVDDGSLRMHVGSAVNHSFPENSDQSVRDEMIAFNLQYKAHSRARLVDQNRFKVKVSTMGFSMLDRIELIRLAEASEQELSNSRITDWLSPPFFMTNFWYMWQTTFAFQPWHSAVELKRYLHRFMNEFPRIETLAGVKRTVYNQYDAIVRPLESWLKAQGVQFVHGARVTDMEFVQKEDKLSVETLLVERDGVVNEVPTGDAFVFFQNGSMTDASSLGSMTQPPKNSRSLTAMVGRCGKRLQQVGLNSVIRLYSTAQFRSLTGLPLQ